jgi:hypothetical protein
MRTVPALSRIRISPPRQEKIRDRSAYHQLELLGRPTPQGEEQ